ncbi:MAG TPA: carbohydrate kinase, partial [Clostridia bacterium]|nr:carbohydrate kinase [Clostridia bacterium]
FNLPAVRLKDKEISAIGAAINAGVWAGFFDSYEEGVKAMVREDKTFWPRPADVAVYEHLYQEVYKKVYKRNESLFKTLEAFTPKNEL